MGSSFYEARCPSGHLKTYLFLPLPGQDLSLQPLNVFMHRIKEPFQFVGEEVGGNLAFFFLGPEGYKYKVLLTAASRNGRHPTPPKFKGNSNKYSWRLTRKGVTRAAGSEQRLSEAIILPKEMCHNPAPPDAASSPSIWTWHGPVPAQCHVLHLEIFVQKKRSSLQNCLKLSSRSGCDEQKSPRVVAVGGQPRGDEGRVIEVRRLEGEELLDLVRSKGQVEDVAQVAGTEERANDTELAEDSYKNGACPLGVEDTKVETGRVKVGKLDSLVSAGSYAAGKNETLSKPRPVSIKPDKEGKQEPRVVSRLNLSQHFIDTISAVFASKRNGKQLNSVGDRKAKYQVVPSSRLPNDQVQHPEGDVRGTTSNVEPGYAMKCIEYSCEDPFAFQQSQLSSLPSLTYFDPTNWPTNCNAIDKGNNLHTMLLERTSEVTYSCNVGGHVPAAEDKEMVHVFKPFPVSNENFWETVQSKATDGRVMEPPSLPPCESRDSIGPKKVSHPNVRERALMMCLERFERRKTPVIGEAEEIVSTGTKFDLKNENLSAVDMALLHQNSINDKDGVSNISKLQSHGASGKYKSSDLPSRETAFDEEPKEILRQCQVEDSDTSSMPKIKEIVNQFNAIAKANAINVAPSSRFFDPTTKRESTAKSQKRNLKRGYPATTYRQGQGLRGISARYSHLHSANWPSVVQQIQESKLKFHESSSLIGESNWQLNKFEQFDQIDLPRDTEDDLKGDRETFARGMMEILVEVQDENNAEGDSQYFVLRYYS